MQRSSRAHITKKKLPMRTFTGDRGQARQCTAPVTSKCAALLAPRGPATPRDRAFRDGFQTGRRSKWLALLGFFLAIGQSDSVLGLDLHKKYEGELIEWALRTKRLKRDPAPAGKIIERIEIAREEIIAQSDPWPKWLNLFHIKTKDYVIRQELLVEPGERWDVEKVAESARNLRQLFILAVVRMIPCKSARKGRVVLLVVTKDLWSIRLNSIFSMVGSIAQKFELFPTEQNLLGRNKRVSLHMVFQQLDVGRVLSRLTGALMPSYGSFYDDGPVIRDQFVVGQLYVDNRLLGSRWNLLERFDLIFAGSVPCGGANGTKTNVFCPEKDAGDLEGTYAFLQLQRPLYSLATKWGFNFYGLVDIRQYRRFQVISKGSAANQIAGQNGDNLILRTDRYWSYPGSPAVPRVYDIRGFQTSASVTRSFGLDTKHDFTSGLTAYSNQYKHPDNLPFDKEVLEWHARNFLPRNEDATYLFFTYHSYSPRFVRLYNIQSFALSEDFVLGHDISLTARFAANLKDISQSFMTLLFSSQYRWYFHDDLLAVWLLGSSRMQAGLDEMGYWDLGYRGTWVNNAFEVGFKNVSPLFWIGRCHLQMFAQLRSNDLDKGRLTLGGDSGLRGYTSEQFEGESLLRLNIEYRSLPINVFTLHLGFVLFYDGGGVFGGPDPQSPQEELAFQYHQTLGLGIRGHFPQFDKESLRIDFGFPLSSDRPAIGNWFTFSFKQVF